MSDAKTPDAEDISDERAWAHGCVAHVREFVSLGFEPGPGMWQNLGEAIDALAALAEGLEKDAARYRWLRDLKCNSFTLGLNEDHACNYMTAADWIDNGPSDFEHDDPAEVQRMRETNTIWSLQVYPNTPISFWRINASTLDAAIDRAAQADSEGAKT